MTRYQPDVYEYDEPEDYPEKYPDKSKRLAYQPHPPTHPLTDIVAWGVLGSVGFVISLGAIVVANNNNSPAVMLIPMFYMFMVMFMMRRRS